MDQTVLYIIGLVAILNTRTDIQVIHAKYDLSTRTKALMFLHHLLILFMILGVFLKTTIFIKMHLFVLLSALVCWFMCGQSCFMADWQRKSINYSEEDLRIIHKSRGKQMLEFFGITIPFILIDLYKLNL